MRVIAGVARGCKLKTVSGMKTRPTADRVKEAVFNMIGPYFDGGSALDLFAGSGALGIEALSRGMARVVFIDRDKKAVEIIRQNLDAANFTTQAEVYPMDAFKALSYFKRHQIAFDVIFLDPPFRGKQLVPVIKYITRYALLHREGVVVAEYAHGDALPSRVNSLVETERRRYGDVAISLFHYHDHAV